MYDIKHLEDEWKKYRKKKLKPWAIGILSFILLSLFTVLFLMNVKIDMGSLKTYFDVSKETLPFEGKINGIQKKKDQNSVLINSALDRLQTNNVTNRVVNQPLNTLVEMDELQVKDLAQAKTKMHLEIIESTSVKAYADVEKRFLESHDIDDALFLARSYYKKGAYEKSEHWALETNKLDEESEESLFIFVKSKAKQGRKNEAVAILTVYIKESNSQEGKKLLYQIQNDTL